MKAITFEAYKTSDGELFESQTDANKHQLDIIGECLDDLLAEDGKGRVTRTDRFNILINMLNDEKLLDKVKALYDAVTFEERELEKWR